MTWLSLITTGQENLLILLSAFIIGGIFKSKVLFLPAFNLLVNNIKSKRMSLMAISLLSGILPIEGRVSVSAPILDSLTCDKKSHTRGKIGILDFIATHHYYLWSPLEKSVIMLMAGLSLTYGQLLSYTIWPLIVYLLYLTFIVFVYIKEDEIPSNIKTDSTFVDILPLLPFIAGIVLSIFYPPYYIFPLVTIWYIANNKINMTQLWSYINWNSLTVVAVVIIMSNIVKSNSDFIVQFLQHDIANTGNIIIIISSIIGGAVSSFILGSSSKYAGICVVITLILGIEYFPIILMAEYVGYLLSPTHKCLVISASYFNTKITEFYKYVGILSVMLIIVGLLQVV